VNTLETEYDQPAIRYEYVSRYGNPPSWRWVMRYHFWGGSIFNDYPTREAAIKYIPDCIVTRKQIYRETSQISFDEETWEAIEADVFS
jgi:hypothetical protein